MDIELTKKGLRQQVAVLPEKQLSLRLLQVAGGDVGVERVETLHQQPGQSELLQGLVVLTVALRLEGGYQSPVVVL